ncbi:MAG TPA: iron-containing alcohol dehydrogenase [Vicinamibacteria bacterium]|nr:iron-containing alcohol dehydrogenase [Vicinamibacteria bacterium]
MKPFDLQPRTRVVYGGGCLERLGALARELGLRRPLLVTDPGLEQAGHAERARRALEAAGLEVAAFADIDHEPDAALVARGAEAARAGAADSFVALGGGSSLDCAKGANFLLTNGGRMADYRGFARAHAPLLPMIGIPTTAGTGSEAQSYALISDESHEKMACGDPGAAFRIALLDPELVASQPRAVAASAGYDALSHAVEAYVTLKRNALSDLFAREAFRLLDGHYERIVADPRNLDACSAMLLGAHWAGAAIEASMLGATHACANPLSTRYGTVHGQAIALMLPHVVRFNSAVAGERYAELLETSGRAPGRDPAARLAERLESLALVAGLPRSLRSIGASAGDLPALAQHAAQQWTGQFNPRPFGQNDAVALYRAAL